MSEKKLTFDDFEEIQQLKEKIVELQLKRTSMEKELSARMTAHMEAQRANPIEDGARALMAGENPTEAVADRKELTATSQKIQIFQRAEAMVRDELQRAETRASAEICESLKPEFQKEWREFAELLVAASEKGAKLEIKYDSLRSRGIRFTGHLPMPLPLEPYDGRQSHSRLNLAVNKISEDWGITVQRPILDASEKKRHQAHGAEAKLKAEAERRAEKARQERRKRAQEQHKESQKRLGLSA